MLRWIQLVCAAVLLTAAAAHAQQGAVVFAAGTQLPIRFLQTLESGRDSIGTPVTVQTMSALTAQNCVAAPAYVQLAGRLTTSRGSRRLGGRGELGIVFDSIRTEPDAWLNVRAVLGTLEYTPQRDLRKTGQVYGTRVSFTRRLSTAGAIVAAAASAVEEVPAALLGLSWVVRHGPGARILAGETGSVRLRESLRLPVSRCLPNAVSGATPTPLVLPAIQPYATNHSGSSAGDAVNFIFAGNAAQLDTAFKAAGWTKSQPRRPVSVAKSIFSTVAELRATDLPVSNQYVNGRAEDVAYELEGPNARIRHHIRLWHVTGRDDLWLGAATMDQGIDLVKLTHRADPHIDDERDYLLRDLEAGGCASVWDYVTLPGALTKGRLAHGQSFVSDAKTVVVQLHSCTG